MQLYSSLFPAAQDTAVALGNFDGVHLGHAAVIQGAVAACTEGLLPTVLTFQKNPLQSLTGNAPPRLQEEGEKARLLQKMGVALLYDLDFPEVRELSPETFVCKVLKKTLRAKQVFCGFNYHFGKEGAGDASVLIRLCREAGIEAHSLPPVEMDGAPVSSTRIRSLLEAGAIEEANRLLGRPFSFSFEVVGGRRIGRTMGTPTLNQPFPDGFILPRFGVYASMVRFGDVRTYGVTNIGVKPTVGADGPLSETWMPEYSGSDLYGWHVQTLLLRFLRPEQKFENMTALRNAILRDGRRAKEILENFCAQEGL